MKGITIGAISPILYISKKNPWYKTVFGKKKYVFDICQNRKGLSFEEVKNIAPCEEVDPADYERGGKYRYFCIRKFRKGRYHPFVSGLCAKNRGGKMKVSCSENVLDMLVFLDEQSVSETLTTLRNTDKDGRYYSSCFCMNYENIMLCDIFVVILRDKKGGYSFATDSLAKTESAEKAYTGGLRDAMRLAGKMRRLGYSYQVAAKPVGVEGSDEIVKYLSSSECKKAIQCSFTMRHVCLVLEKYPIWREIGNI